MGSASDIHISCPHGAYGASCQVCHLESTITALKASLQATEDGFAAERTLRIVREACLASAEKEIDGLKVTLRRVAEAARDLIQSPSLLKALGRDHSSGCECSLCRVQRALADL